MDDANMLDPASAPAPEAEAAPTPEPVIETGASPDPVLDPDGNPPAEQSPEPAPTPQPEPEARSAPMPELQPEPGQSFPALELRKIEAEILADLERLNPAPIASRAAQHIKDFANRVIQHFNL